MAGSRTWLRAWIALLALAIGAMPVSGAHLHLCFDGAEPPAALHTGEDGLHHEGEGAGSTHQDVDVVLDGNALAKKLGGTFDLPDLLATPFVLFRVPVTPAVVVPREHASPLNPFPAFRILPPLRAPPV